MTERFRTRTLASFSRHQLENVTTWAQKNVVDSNGGMNYALAFYRALEVAEKDEKGKLMTERGRERLKLALKVFAALATNKVELETIQDAIVWSTPNPSRVNVELHRTSSYYSPKRF